MIEIQQYKLIEKGAKWLSFTKKVRQRRFE